MVRFFRTPEFIELKDQWYQKLKEEGFEDLEDESQYIKKIQHLHFFRWTPLKIQTQRDYYIHCEYFLNSHSFKKEQHRKIWELYTKGVPFRKISEKVDQGLKEVHQTVKRLRKKMWERLLYE